MRPLNTRLLSRRTMLRAGGVALGLPLLDAMTPLGLGAEAAAAAQSPRRMVLISRPLGVHAPHLFPETAGLDYESTRYLKLLDAHRGRFTVFSGLSHLDYPNAHHTESGLWTGVSAELMQRDRGTRNTVSLDVLAAEQLGSATRFPHLALGGSHSYNHKGVRVPSLRDARQMFRQLFLDGSPEEIAREMQRIRDGRSILDGVREEVRSLTAGLGPGDRERIDTMLASVREAEQRLAQDEAWVARPKPKVKFEVKDYKEEHLVERERQWFSLIHLALQTDSTRVIALNVHSHVRPQIDGVNMGHHDASHHGQDPGKIEQLTAIEENEFRVFAELLAQLSSTPEHDGTLLDRTTVVHASNLGNASAHTTNNLPILVAGGGFRHAGHVAFDSARNRSLCNLYVRILNQLGIESDRFGSSEGILSELG